MARADPAQADLLESLAHEYPRWTGESAIHYAERLAVLAGALRRQDAVVIGASEDLARRGRSDEPEIRLPYKDD